MDSFQDLNDLYFFAKVVDFGSFTAAAEALGLQTSKLSRRVGALENEFGVRLLNRTTRKLSLTEAGKTFHRHCVALIAEAEAAKDAINQTLSAPQGMVRVSCPTGLLQGGVAKILAGYLSAHPQVRIALEATNRRVDVVDEGIDIAIRVRVPPVTGGFRPDDAVIRRIADDPGGKSRARRRSWAAAIAGRHRANVDAVDGNGWEGAFVAFRRCRFKPGRTDSHTTPKY
jgi:DNA-binding transcriptional LysR family regulator